MDNGIYINVEEFKHLLNNSKYYGTKVWDDICNMLYNCGHYAQRNSSNN